MAAFPEQEKELYKIYKKRRALGMVVDAEYLKTKMKFLVQATDSSGKDKFKGTCRWLAGYQKRWGISKQKKTNKKNKSVKERLPQVSNFHYYCIYQMRLEEP